MWYSPAASETSCGVFSPEMTFCHPGFDEPATKGAAPALRAYTVSGAPGGSLSTAGGGGVVGSVEGAPPSETSATTPDVATSAPPSAAAASGAAPPSLSGGCARSCAAYCASSQASTVLIRARSGGLGSAERNE